MSTERDPNWEAIRFLKQWLDDGNEASPAETRLLRIFKIAEELGEVTEAVIGVTGQNPRKGFTHSWEDVKRELADVIVTAMVALESLDSSGEIIFTAHLDRLVGRAKKA